MRRRHREVDAPVLVEEPLVLGWFTRATTRGTPNSCLDEQRDHEVVLVVAGRGDHDVAALEPGLAQRRHLARVGDEPLDPVVGVGALDHGRVLLDELHLVPRAHEVVGDEEPDVAGSGDRDAHQSFASGVDVGLQLVGGDDLGHEHEHVALLADHVGGHDLRLTEARRPR